MSNINSQIDLEEKIFKIINTKMPGLSQSYQRLISYFLKEDLISALGKTTFDDEEIEILSVKGRVGNGSNEDETEILSTKENAENVPNGDETEILSTKENSVNGSNGDETEILSTKENAGNVPNGDETEILSTKENAENVPNGDETEILSTKESVGSSQNNIGTKEGLLITTIFGSNYKINYRTDGLDAYKIPTDEEGKLNFEDIKKVFSITLGPDVITNTVIVPKGIVGPEFSTCEDFELESTYEVNIPDSSFRYSCGEKGKKEPSFKACLSGFNAKFSSLEMLCYNREIPPVEREKNIFKRFTKSRFERGEGVINITTSSSLTELTDYAEVIFKILKREAAKINKSNESNYGKYLRAINEEN